MSNCKHCLEDGYNTVLVSEDSNTKVAPQSDGFVQTIITVKIWKKRPCLVCKGTGLENRLNPLPPDYQLDN